MYCFLQTFLNIFAEQCMPSTSSTVFTTTPSHLWVGLRHWDILKPKSMLTDPDAYLMIESSMRSGISQISCRFAEANNKYAEEGITRSCSRASSHTWMQTTYTARRWACCCHTKTVYFWRQRKSRHLMICRSTRKGNWIHYRVRSALSTRTSRST